MTSSCNMEESTLTLDITIDEEFLAMEQILTHIRPSWSWDSVREKHFTAGITNKICGFYLNTDSKWNDMILVRLYGRNTETIIDREAERRNMKIMNYIGAGPALYTVLNNGLAYGFVQGGTTDEKTVREPVIRELIAKQMARIHSIDLSQHPDVDQTTPIIFSKIYKILDVITQPLSDPVKQSRLEAFGKSISDLRQEVDEMTELVQKHATSPGGFTHNDLLLENIVYNAEEGKVSFIDYEFGGYNYLYFDIANHFAEYAGVEAPDHTLYPDKDYMRQWLSIYLSEYSQTCGDNSLGALTDEMLNDTCDEVNMFCLWSHLFWGCWAIVQAENSNIPFDFMAFAISRLGAYFNKKDEFIAFTKSK